MDKCLQFMCILMCLLMMMMMLHIMSNQAANPMMIIISLIIYSMLVCLNLSPWKSNYLYSIMLFLIMISGMLIIFLYFASIISNEQMKLMPQKFTLFMLSTLLMAAAYLLNDKKILNSTNLIYTFKENSPINSMLEKSFLNILNLYEYPYSNMSISCMFYLLLALLTIIKICSLKMKPLRKLHL